MRIKYYIIIVGTVVLVSLLGSCRKALFGDDVASDDYVAIFDILWDDFDRHYAPFEVRGVNWDSLYTVYRPKVSPTMGKDSLFNVFSSMLDHLDDLHVWISGQDENRYYSFNSGYLKRYMTCWWWDCWIWETGNIPSSFDWSLYLDYNIRCAKIAKRNIGYIYIGQMYNYNINLIDSAFEKVWDMDALIIDVRTNGGGNVEYSERIAGHISDNTDTVIISQFRNGRLHSSFSEPFYHTNPKYGKEQFTKPIVLLTNQLTGSAAEWFTLAAKTYKHVTHIGDTTAGAFSCISSVRMLPNGWTYRYPIQKVSCADGTTREGVGNIPDIVIQNLEEENGQWSDRVHDAALDYIKKEYDI